MGVLQYDHREPLGALRLPLAADLFPTVLRARTTPRTTLPQGNLLARAASPTSPRHQEGDGLAEGQRQGSNRL